MPKQYFEKKVLDFVPKGTFREVVQKFLIYFPLGLLLVFVTLLFISRDDFQRKRELLAQDEVSRLELIKYIIGHDLETVSSDLGVLADSEALNRFLDDSSPKNKQDLETRMLLFAKDRKVFDQTRLLNMAGDEVIRVNMKESPVTVPTAQLQNKKDRYYFEDTLSLSKGDIFVSPLDLNIEEGEIEVPYVPVIRVGTPIFDNSGTKRGVILLNYRARSILGRFKDAYPKQSIDAFSILNKEGYWLLSSAKDKEWGFMFGNNYTLASEQPDLWEIINKKIVGQREVAEGLYTYTTIYPARIIMGISEETKITDKDSTVLKKQYDDVWFLILTVPRDELTYMVFLKQYSHLVWVIPTLIVFIALCTMSLAVMRVKKIYMDQSLVLLSTAIEQSPAAVIITDVDGCIQYGNKKFEHMSGYSREEFLGENPRIFKSGKTTNEVYGDLWNTVLKGDVWVGDFENKNKNDVPYYVSAKIAPMFTRSGQIRNLLALQEDVTEKRLLQKKLEQLATTDGLTGVSNRSHFMSTLSVEFNRAKRYDQPLTLLAFDLDKFKSINDTYGHLGGDQVLKQFAKAVSSELRESDCFGRMGGEEFSALLVGTDLDGGRLLAERLREKVAELVVSFDNHRITFTVSIGCSNRINRKDEVDELLKRADKSLYLAKTNGRNRVEVWQSDMVIPA